MNYNDDWREERRRHKENSNYNPRWENQNERQGSGDSGYRNNSEFATSNSGSIDSSDHRYESNRNSEQNSRSGRNPSWDQNAPNSSMNEGRNQNEGRNHFQERDFERSGNYGNTYQGRINDNRPNQNYSAQGMSDPRYGNPQFSDRQRRGSTGGSSDRYERANYGDNTDYRSSGQNFENAPQGRYGSHTQGWDDNEDYRDGKSLGRRDLRDSGTDYASGSHRGKGPKNYKRDDSRVKDDVNDALTDHHNIDASHINVEVKEGNVILSGHVENRQAKREAEYAIDYISGVNNVENRIHVESKSNDSGSSSSNSSSSESDSKTGSNSNDSKYSDDENKSSSDTSKRNGKTTV